MKHFVFILTLLCSLPLSSSVSLAQRLENAHSGRGSSRAWGVHGGISYLVHQKKFLRQNYDNGFPVSDIDFPPLSVELGALHRLTTAIDLVIDAGARKHVLQAQNGVQNKGTLRIFPVSLSLRRVWRFESGENPYLTLGGAIYWSRFTSTLLITGELGPDLLGEYRFAKNYSGMGALAEAGILERLSTAFYLDLGIRYDYTRLGNSQNGGLGNVGGTQIRLKTIYYF